MLFTATQLFYSLSMWLVKRTIAGAYNWMWPAATRRGVEAVPMSQSQMLTREEIKKLRETLKQLMDLHEERLQRVQSTTRIDTLANSIVMEACEDEVVADAMRQSGLLKK